MWAVGAFVPTLRGEGFGTYTGAGFSLENLVSDVLEVACGWVLGR
jgi:hypothetical protein